ncbi:dTDP-4-dehydrorhamnose reductase [Mycolicibacterium sp.]|uniref:dTDP-4-dehydrorhamnose reductase n=1 Tax=Mycolicibacterium sp. TaxID=2320850 RepID=UPI0035604B2D
MSNRIVITGAAGQVGRFLTARATAEGRAVLALNSAQWNIADPAAAPALSSDDVVVNCAAYTNVDGAEAAPADARAVNATGPANVARACAAAGARLIHISTDYVFGGDTDRGPGRPYELDDPADPVNVYGASKLDGERAVAEALPTATVVRTSWVYTGGSGNDFVAVMAGKARAGQAVDVVDDQVGSPTYTGDLVAALLQIVDERPAAPLLHAGNGGEASRFDQARAVYAAVGADPDLVRPVGSGAHPRPAARPSYSALAHGQSERAGLRPLPPWQDAVARALAGA